MNPSMANFMLKLTPNSILHPHQTIHSRTPLNNGRTIPLRGYLPSPSTDSNSKEQLKKDVRKAIRDGWRLWQLEALPDSPVNEAMREAIEEGIVERSDLFVVVQIPDLEMKDGLRRVENFLDGLLKDNNFDYVDLCELCE